MKKIQFLFLLLLVLLVFGLGTRIVRAEDLTGETEESEQTVDEIQKAFMSEFDFKEIEKSLLDMFPEEKINFEDVVSSFVSGNLNDTGNLLIECVEDMISYEFRYSRHNLAYILLVALAAAVFTNFAGTFRNRQISDISFYVLYMLLITFCLASFQTAVQGIEVRIDSLLGFMKVLCPAYFLAVAFAAGSTTSMLFYNTVLFLIYVVELLIARFLLPIINVYIMVRIMGSLTGEDFLSELSDLLKKAVTWSLRALLAGVIGINTVQGLLAPAIDSLKRSTVTRTAEALPWVGNALGGTAEIFLGTAILIKNGIGMAGAVIAVLISIIPILQMAIMALMYKLAAAVVQPVSDKRITACIGGVSEGYELMLRVVFTAAALFLLTIAVAAVSTS